MPHRPPAPAIREVEPRPGSVFAWVDRLLSRLSPTVLVRGSAVIVLGLALSDYYLGPDIFIAFAYLFPVAAAAWYGSSNAGYLLCILAALTSLGADALAREIPLPTWVIGWNVVVRLATFLAFAALTRRLREAIAVVRTLALSDPLTQLANARAFFERLTVEVDRAARYGSVFTVAYLDLDRFKEVNDTLGHAEGDAVLRTVADTMRRTTRSSDLTARLGGDEFGVLLPETPFGRAEGALGKLRTEILVAMASSGWPVTVSMGAVTFETPTESADDALNIADGLMYEVKQNGADGIRHVLWTGEPTEDSGPATPPTDRPGRLP